MGGNWEVAVWGQWWLGTGVFNEEQYHYKTFYRGGSLCKALYTFWQYRKGHGCVTISWRGGL